MNNENMKSEYIAAEMEIVVLESEDIITTSCTCDGHDESEDSLY